VCVCACVCVCVYIYIIYVSIRVDVCCNSIFLHININIYTCMYVCMYKCVHARTKRGKCRLTRMLDNLTGRENARQSCQSTLTVHTCALRL